MIKVFREDEDIRINNIQARGFVFKDDLILVMFRQREGKRYYVFPGGHMQQGETPQKTTIREVEEETNIKCSIVAKAYEYFDYHSEIVEQEYYFVCKWLSGDPILSGEESRRSTKQNFYKPQWLKISELETTVILPQLAKEWIVKYINNNQLNSLIRSSQ